MRILLLCEGDPESVIASSGYAKSLLDALRAQGHVVHPGDVDIRGPTWLVAAARSFSVNRRRWGIRYHTGEHGFARRSRIAGQHIARMRGQVDAILQIGATFEPKGSGSIPYFLYCDSSMRMGSEESGSWAAALSRSEIDAVIQREARVYRGASAIFTFSDFVRWSFVHQVGIPAGDVIATYVGANLDVRAVPARQPLDVNSPPTVLFVGKEFVRKGGDVLLRAFRRVRSHVTNAQLVIIGPPDLRVDDPGVVSLGFLRKDDPVALRRLTSAYAAADVFCLPTRYEPFGIVILEAMFHGLPCIATRNWSIPEMIRDNETGYTVPADDEAALADRLLGMLSDRARAREMGRAGRAHAEERFTWPAVAGRMTQEMERRTASQARRDAPVGAGGTA